MPQSNSMANDAITISDSEPESDPPRANLDRSNNLKHAPQRFGYGSRVQNFTESVSSPLYPTPSRFVSPSSAHAFSSHCLPPIQQSYPPIGHIPHPQGEYSNLINQSLSYQSPAQNDWGYIRYPSNQPHIQNRRVSVAQNRSSLTASYPNINAGTNFGSRLSPLDEQRARTEHQIPEIQQIPEEQQVSKKQRSQEKDLPVCESPEDKREDSDYVSESESDLRPKIHRRQKFLKERGIGGDASRVSDHIKQNLLRWLEQCADEASKEDLVEEITTTDSRFKIFTKDGSFAEFFSDTKPAQKMIPLVCSLTDLNLGWNKVYEYRQRYLKILMDPQGVDYIVVVNNQRKCKPGMTWYKVWRGHEVARRHPGFVKVRPQQHALCKDRSSPGSEGQPIRYLSTEALEVREKERQILPTPETNSGFSTRQGTQITQSASRKGSPATCPSKRDLSNAVTSEKKLLDSDRSNNNLSNASSSDQIPPEEASLKRSTLTENTPESNGSNLNRSNDNLFRDIASSRVTIDRGQLNQSRHVDFSDHLSEDIPPRETYTSSRCRTTSLDTATSSPSCALAQPHEIVFQFTTSDQSTQVSGDRCRTIKRLLLEGIRHNLFTCEQARDDNIAIVISVSGLDPSEPEILLAGNSDDAGFMNLWERIEQAKETAGTGGKIYVDVKAL